MSFFSKTLDKLKGALRKTAAVLNTDVRTLFIPGRQIDEAFLRELEEKFLQADLGVANVEKIIGEIRENWRVGKIKNAAEAEQIVRRQLLSGWPTQDRELRQAASGPTVILVAGINGAGKDDEHRQAGLAAEGSDAQEGDGVRERYVSGGGGGSTDDLVGADRRGDRQAPHGSRPGGGGL